jgi:3-oxoacyl-[acyl-carrier protein] reductase
MNAGSTGRDWWTAVSIILFFDVTLYLQGGSLDHAIYPDLKGKFALVTGASRGNGIGAAICGALAMQGANILFTTWQAYDREQPYGVDVNGPMALEQALLNCGVKVRRLEIDLAHSDCAAQVLDAAQEWLGLPTCW